MAKYLDHNSKASDPVGVRLSRKKLDIFRKKFPWWSFFSIRYRIPEEYFDEHLLYGDSRAAIVIRTRPDLIVAAYTDELDCVVNMKFPKRFVRDYELSKGSRLLTVNTYFVGSEVVRDIIQGPCSYRQYSNFRPLIAEFLSDDIGIIENRKSRISEDEWRLTQKMADDLVNAEAKPRKGCPFRSDLPARL